MRHALLLISLFSLPLAAALPDGGQPLVKPDNFAPEHMSVRHGNGAFGNHQILPATHNSFSEILALTVTKQPPNTWDVAISVATTAPVKKNDLLLVGFWARGKSANGGGVAEFVFERGSSPHTKSIQYLVETPTSGDWQQYWVRFRSLEDYSPGGALLNFQGGYVPCSFELGGMQAWNFGDKVQSADLPHTALTYVGREPEAGWRAEAARRIDKHRKAELAVTVLDASGKPKAGATVTIRMNRLAFDLGSAVKSSLLIEDSPNAQRYRDTFTENFNFAVLENGLKWKHWDEYPRNQLKAINALHWLRDQHIPVRGHVMVWPGYRHLPSWIQALDKQPDVLRRVIDAHIREVGYAAGDLVREWDVMNELYANRDLTNILGQEETVRWFKVAKQVAPHAKRYYNDYAGLVRGGFPTTHKDHFEETLRYLIDNGAPIDGIGIQGHFGSLLTTPDRLYSGLERWAALGKTILITEFDVTVPDSQLRADFTRDFLTICFSHPRVTGVVSWGFWAKAHWRPESAFFDSDWNITPMGKQWVDFAKTWRSDATLVTDAEGKVKLRALLGDYSITTEGAQTTLKHKKPGSQITLSLP